jgi:hypothetical protein
MALARLYRVAFNQRGGVRTLVALAARQDEAGRQRWPDLVDNVGVFHRDRYSVLSTVKAGSSESEPCVTVVKDRPFHKMEATEENRG